MNTNHRRHHTTIDLRRIAEQPACKDRFRECRLQRGYSQEYVAGYLYVDPSYVSQMESKGKGCVTRVRDIAAALNVPASILFFSASELRAAEIFLQYRAINTEKYGGRVLIHDFGHKDSFSAVPEQKIDMSEVARFEQMAGRLSCLRTQRKLTLENVAAGLGISLTTVHNLECGKTEYSFRLRELAKGIHVPAPLLFCSAAEYRATMYFMRANSSGIAKYLAITSKDTPPPTFHAVA